MKKTEVARQAMHKTVLKTMDDHTGSWQEFLPFHEEVAALRALILQIDNFADTQTETNSVGFTNQKKRAYNAMIEEAHKLSVKLNLWAQKQKNDLVLSATSLSITAIKRLAEAEQLATCRLIQKKAGENLADLGNYKITAETVAKVQQLNDAAAGFVLDKSTTGNTHKTATTNIGDIIKQVTAVLETLDDLIKAFIKEKDPVFATTYAAARKVYVHRSGNNNPKNDDPQQPDEEVKP